MIEWKKASRHLMNPLPGDLYLKLLATLPKHFSGFDLITVPAPSFHTYDHYPIWEIAKQIGAEINIKVINLFPNKSGKLKMMTFGSCTKEVQIIQCPPNKFILILDDIYTTGFTMKVTAEAIIKGGSFPCGIAIG